MTGLFAHIAAMDPSIGRVDKSALSHQTLMELLVSNLKYSASFTDADGSYRDISTWDGVAQENDSVTVINWFYCSYLENPVKPGGSIDLQWIPETVTSFNIGDLKLCGSVDTPGLPRGMQLLQLYRNRLHGTFSIENLPNGLFRVEIYENKMSGRLDLTCLPPTLVEFRAAQNSFSGEIDLTTLPATLESLSLYRNLFNGTINLEHLPRTIKSIVLYENEFKQDELRLPSSPDGQSRIMVSTESFLRIVDENGTDREETMRQMSLSYVVVRF